MKRLFSVVIAFCLANSQVFAQQEIYMQKVRSAEAFKSPIVRGVATGSLVAVTSVDKGLKILDLKTMAERFSYPILPNALSSLRWTRDGVLATARIDGQINYWVPGSPSMASSFTGHTAGISDFAINGEGHLVLACSDNLVTVVDGTTGERMLSLSMGEDRITSFAWHQEGKKGVVSLSSGKLMILDSALILSNTVVTLPEPATAMAFSPDGKTLVAGGMRGSLSLWETQTWAMQKGATPHRSAVTGFSFDPEMRWIASTSGDSTLTVSDARSLATVKTLHEQGVLLTFAAFTSQDAMVTGDSKGSLATWRVLERPPDTTAPALTILHPTRYSEDAPSRQYATQYEVLGLAYDESDIKEVLVGNQKAVVTDPKVQNTTASGAGLKGKEFRATINLPVVGANRIEVKAIDASNNATVQPLFIQRLSKDQALEILGPSENTETEGVAIDVQFKPLFEVASYTISANTVDFVEARGPLKIRSGDIVKEEIPLIVGYNQIAVNVVSKKGERFTKLVGVNRKFSAAVAEAPRYSPGARKEAGGPQRWAVIVGVSEYANKGIPPLTYADKDAEALAAFLQTPEGGSFDKDHMRILINRDATLANLRDGMIDFLQQAIDKDLVVIYFAGHGAPDPTRPQNLYLLTYDSDPSRLGTTAFPMWDIQTVITRQIQAKKVVVLSDACHSGGISVDVATRGLDVTNSNPINQYLAELARAKDGMVVFTASAAGEVSQEFPELGHGVFTYYLLDGLKGTADTNNDYIVTVNEMMGYVEEQVKRKTRGAQNPTRSQTTYDKELPMSVINK